MADVKVSLRVKVAWWLRPYAHALFFFCWLHRCEPDESKLDAAIRRAVRVKVIKAG